MPALLLACIMGVGGCSNTSGPVAWWHNAVGGKIAQERPPPPGNDDPYPNLATVPAKPAAANAAEWNQRTTGLVTDRIKADQSAALAPIPAPVTASRSTGTGPQLPPAPNQAPAASAALVGVTPPQPGNGPTPSSTTPGQTAKGQRVASPQAPTPAGASVPGVATAGSTYAGFGTAQRVANGQLPALPAEPPPRPGIAPPPPPPLVPITVAPPLAASPVGIAIDFAPNSAALNDPALADLKALAASRGDRGIAITGYGGATSSDPVVQSDALGLGLSRAKSLATALVAQGVPYAMLRLNAEAAGRGASLRLLQ